MSDPVFFRRVERLHALGPRAVGELLLEIEAGASLAERLPRYADLDGDVIRALGCSDFPPLPLRRIA